LREPLGYRISTVHDPYRLGLTFKAASCFGSVLPFGTESVLNKRSTQNWLLTSKDTDLGKTFYTKVVDNLDTFPASIYTPTFNKWSGSNDL
jgi:hypothetical protein